MTIHQRASFDVEAAGLNATSKKNPAVAKMVAAWENKNAKRAMQGSGLALMAMSLTACGGSSSTVTPAATTETATTTVVAAKSFTLTAGKDALTGGDGADTFTSSGANFSVLDALTGGAGADILNITDTTKALVSGAPTGASITGIETINIDASAGVGGIATTAVAQVNTYAAVTVTANVAQTNQYIFNTSGSTGSDTYTYGGNAGTFTYDGSTAATSATAFVAALNTTAGSTVATVGKTEADGGLAATTATTSGALVFTSAATALKVGMSVTGTGVTAGSFINSISSDSKTITLNQNVSTAITTSSGDLTFGGGTAGVTVHASTAGTVSPALSLGDASTYAGSLVRANTNGSEGSTVTVNYGGTAATYLVGATADATGVNLAAAINSVAGATVAVNASGVVTLTSPVAGTALSAITFTGVGTDIPGVTYTTANVVGVTGGVYDMSGFTGVTNVVAEAAGAVNLKLASTTDATITTTSGAMTLAGGQNLTLTHGNTGANDITVAAGKDVTVTANKATTGDVTLTAPTGVADVNYNGSFANTANATLGGVTVSSAGASVDVDVTSGASGAALAATNYTVTQGAISVTGGTTTTSVAVSQDAAVTAVAGTTATGKIGVVQGGVTIADGAANTTGTDTLTTATIENFGATTITSTVLNTLNVTADAKNASGAVTIDKSGAGLETSATTLTVKGGGKMGAIDGTQADVYTTVAFNADTALTVADVNFAKATAISASGAGVTTITAHTDDGLVTSYTSTGGGLKVSAEIGTAVAFTGSAGTDAVLVAGTTKAISMGAGDDSVTMSAALGTGGSIAGGDGTDTLVINVAASTFADAASEPRITSFEKLEIGTAGNGAYNGAGFTSGYKLTGALTGNSSITNAVANSTIEIGVTTAKTLDVVYANATGTADVANIVLSSAAALDLDTNADVTFAGVETINITSTDTNTTAHQNTLDLDVTSAISVVATGNAGLVMVNTGNVAMTSFDAGGITMAAITDSGLTFTSTNVTVGATVTITGTNGVDALTGTTNANDTIIGGAGVDTIVYTGGTDSFSGGAGNDVFDVNAFGTKTSFLTITDIADGDTIDLAGVSTSGTIADVSAANWKGDEVKLGASATLDQYLTAALDGNGGTNELVEWFVFGGDTYIAITSDNSAGFNAGDDMIVVLSGIHNIEDSSLTSQVLTIA